MYIDQSFFFPEIGEYHGVSCGLDLAVAEKDVDVIIEI